MAVCVGAGVGVGAGVVGAAVGVGAGVVGAAVGVGAGVVGAAVGVGAGVMGAAVGVGDGVMGAAVGVGAGVVGAGVVGAAVGVGAIAFSRAFCALMRVPLSTFPISAGIASPVVSSASFTCRYVRFGCLLQTKVARPATCGVAIEVPLYD